MNLKKLFSSLLCGALFGAPAFPPKIVGADSPSNLASYQVLDPIESGDVTLYPIVRTHPEEKAAHWRYLTLDEGLKSGDVIITEAGKAHGLVRSRRRGVITGSPAYAGDAVNTLVLINRSSRPLLLLAGEIVTGGKQDRVIAKDRIVPAQSRPINLSVFCIEPGRWVESSPKFGVAGKDARSSFMVEPSVRRQTMAAQSQREVWNAVGRSIGSGSSGTSVLGHSQSQIDLPSADSYDANRAASTTSYAQAMQAPQMSDKVEAVAAPVLGENNEMIGKLRQGRVVGVVAAIDGHIVWADLFANTDLLAAYWSKLVRSYAAESIHQDSHDGPKASKEEALRFAADATNGEETSDGETALYRYREVRGSKESEFILEALLPGTGFEIHRTKLVQSRDIHSDPEKHDFHIY